MVSRSAEFLLFVSFFLSSWYVLVNIQPLAFLKMLVVVDKIVSLLLERSVVYACILTGLGRTMETDWAVQGLWGVFSDGLAISSWCFIEGRWWWCGRFLFDIAPIGNTERAPLTKEA
jgi:hypothetical protein